MTFERFYSIIRPHKAASFNTVKRARNTIATIVIFSILYHIPYSFIVTNAGKICVAYYPTVLLQIYYWMSFVMAYVLPSVLLISMNSVIIHTLRKRSNLLISKTEGEGRNEGQVEGSKRSIKQSEKQIYIMLLLVAFSFLILTTPVYVWLLFINFNQSTTPYYYAANHLFSQVAVKTLYTNYAINFFLYVTSGHKFRADLKTLFPSKKGTKRYDTHSSLQTSTTDVSH